MGERSEPREQLLNLDLPGRWYALATYADGKLTIECGPWLPAQGRPSRKRGAIQRLTLQGVEVTNLRIFLDSLFPL